MSKINIYDMELHQVDQLPDGTMVMRVAGGWIYTFMTMSYNGVNHCTDFLPITSTFVPFDNEFFVK